MAPEPRPIELDTTPPEAVVEFGSPPPARRRWNTGGLGRGLAADRRAVPLTAGLAALAILVSLISEWQVTEVNQAVFVGGNRERTLPTDFTDLGALGAGYLVGVFLLAATVVLTLFGPPAGRLYARLVGLSAGGTLIGLLLALATSLSGQSRVISRLYTMQVDNDDITLAHGRGLWCAFAGVLLAVLALHLAGRHLPGAALAPATAGPAAGEEAPPVADEGWAWRRPAAPADEEPVDAPLELTVGPAKPFTPLGDDRDRPGRPGIST